jgi:hypothetical protein
LDALHLRSPPHCKIHGMQDTGNPKTHAQHEIQDQVSGATTLKKDDEKGSGEGEEEFCTLPLFVTSHWLGRGMKCERWK